MIQTHISWVFLTGEFAYKVKKPVNFGFLDFTSLKQREHFCRQELKLNARLAPELYLDVLPVAAGDGGFRLGEDGKIVDYCLKMRQFDQRDLLDRRLAEQRFDPAWMDMLAEDVARFHARAETGPEIRAFGEPERLREHIDANLDVARAHLGQAVDEATLQRLLDFAGYEYEKQQDRLRERQQADHIRACHGDLHLKNITLFQGQPRIFDCIEFNDEFRMIDTMNDVAFLVMDCDARGQTDLGMRFLSRYLEHSGDYEGLHLLRLYCFYRAGVRGKVACLTAADPSLDDQARRRQFDEARHYFALAASYTQPTSPRLFAVGGLSGSGKSHLALTGCGPMRAVIIRSDATRKRLAREEGIAELYTPQMNRKTYAAMFKAAETVLSAGFSVILDATFLDAGQRQRVHQLAEKLRLPLHFYWLDFAPDVLRRRIRDRQQQGRDVSDADLAVLEMQLADYQCPKEEWIEFLHDSSTWPHIKD